MEDTTPKDTSPEVDNVATPDGEGTAPSTSDEPTPEVPAIKDVIGDALGMKFSSDDAALKTVKDNRSHIGKLSAKLAERDKTAPAETAPAETAPAETPKSDNSDVQEQIDELRDESFYARNQQYDTPEYRELLSAIKTTGKSLSDAVKTTAFRAVFDKASAHDADEKAKSVLKTNTNLGQLTDKAKTAREHLTNAEKSAQAGDNVAAREQHAKASEAAVDAVMDAYDSK